MTITEYMKKADTKELHEIIAEYRKTCFQVSIGENSILRWIATQCGYADSHHILNLYHMIYSDALSEYYDRQVKIQETAQ